jgi:hypothetical protein
MTRVLALVLILLYIPGSLTAQDSLPSGHLSILLPPGVPSESFHITYALEGSFGSHGENVRSMPNVSSYVVATAVEGKAAKRLLMVAWAPGCETRTYQLKLRGSGDRQLTFECEILPSVTLTGRIHPAQPVAERPSELVIRYLASWQCQFFGWMACMVPQIEVATVTPDEDGTFEVQLPDFNADPVISASKDLRGVRGEFWLSLRDPKTWNPIAKLEPEIEDLRTPAGTLKVLSAYPSDLVFEANFTIR